MGTGRTNSARASRRPVKFATPNSRAKKVGTGAVTLTRRTLSFSGSCAAVTTTPPTPSWNPFLLASFFAAVTAPLTFDGRKTTPASAPASAARCTRIMFTSNHDASATRPVKPRSSVSISANTTRVCPRSSSSLARDIERHHGVVGDPDRVEVRHEEAERRLRAIRVHDGHTDGVDRRDVVPRARLPGLTLLHEVERLTVDGRSSVELVVPDVHQAGGLRAVAVAFQMRIWLTSESLMRVPLPVST